MLNIAGIDYGSKMAGTTVIAHLKNEKIHFFQSIKKKDADRFLMHWAEQKRPELIFLDAPLSLPGVYRSMEGYEDYFYRAADRELGAMSPMFLGGLTARAMRLNAQLSQIPIQVIEIYPSKLAELLGLKEIAYKKQKEHIAPNTKAVRQWTEKYQFSEADIQTWHHFDALLALISGLRFLNKDHECFGDEKEGCIVV